MLSGDLDDSQPFLEQSLKHFSIWRFNDPLYDPQWKWKYVVFLWQDSEEQKHLYCESDTFGK